MVNGKRGGSKEGKGRKEGTSKSLHRGLRPRKVVDLACVYY